MKNLLFPLFLCCFTVFNITAQDTKAPIPRLKKYDIAQTGCKIYMPEDPKEFSMSKSEDGSEVYVGETSFASFNYGLICVRLLEPVSDKKSRGELLENYMNYLKGQLGITAAAGYGKGHTLDSNPEADGIIDYWEDAESNQWLVKGWVDANFVAVLFIYGKTEHPYFNVTQMYLDGFRFPEK